MHPPSRDHLAILAELDCQLKIDELYKHIEGDRGLRERGIVKAKGGFRTIEPRPIAVRLAERQWKDWGPQIWDQVLTGDIGSDLKVSAAKRLAELNTAGVARNVVNHVCRKGGPFDQINSVNLSEGAEVLSALAEINPGLVANSIGRLLDRLDDLHQLGRIDNRHLVRALSKIAFHSESFQRGARLLFRLTVAEPQFRSSDASRSFVKLFSPVLGGTEANGTARLQLLEGLIRKASKTNDPVQMKHIIDALDEGCTVMSKYFRRIGPEIQGSRRALDSWHPITQEEYSKYIAGCIVHLGNLAVRNDAVGEKARQNLGGSISSLIRGGFFEEVEKAIFQVLNVGHSWTVALRQLKVTLIDNFNQIDDDIVNRINQLISNLEPTILRDRIRVQLLEPPMPGSENEKLSLEEQFVRHRTNAQELAHELLRDPKTLEEILPELSTGDQSMTDELGKSLAKFAKSPNTLLKLIVQAVKDVPAPKRSYDLLAGFVAGLPPEFYNEVEEFKTRAIALPELAAAVPLICRKVGLMADDIDRAIDALKRKTLSPWDLHPWTLVHVLGKVSATKVALLLDAMLDYSASSFALAVTILGRILSDENRKENRARQCIFSLADFRPQLLKMIQNAARWSKEKIIPPPQIERSGIPLNVIEYHFEEIVLRMLAKGREDSDACKVALALARTLAHGEHDDWLIPWSSKRGSVLTKMLTGFPEIVWPIIGGTILENARFSNRMKYALGQPYNLDHNIVAPILTVPEGILFSWCHANREGAPAFIAQCVPFLYKDGDDADGTSLHPVMSRLLDEFGERDDVHKALEGHIGPYHWIDSCAGHYARLEKIFQQLETHPSPEVREWAEKTRIWAISMFKRETIRDEEREAQGVWIG